MVWFFGLSAVVVLLGYLYFLYDQGDIPTLVRALRWFIGIGTLLLAGLFALGQRYSVASVLAAVGIAVVWRGRLGPIDFNTVGGGSGRKSRVRSRFFEMQLDHETGTIEGKIVSGPLRGRTLISVTEEEMRALLADAASDPDSLALLETWLDANRDGWREHLGETGSGANGATGAEPQMDAAQAHDILGLSPGATAEEIRTAHRRLLRAVHPDQGGSNYLAARINAAKDFLLRRGAGG